MKCRLTLFCMSVVAVFWSPVHISIRAMGKKRERILIKYVRCKADCATWLQLLCIINGVFQDILLIEVRESARKAGWRRSNKGTLLATSTGAASRAHVA